MYLATPLILLVAAAMALAAHSNSAGGLQPVERARAWHTELPRNLGLAPRATAADAEALGLAIPAKCKATCKPFDKGSGGTCDFNKNKSCICKPAMIQSLADCGKCWSALTESMGGSVKGLVTEALSQCKDAGHPVQYDVNKLDNSGGGSSSSTTAGAAAPKASGSGKDDKAAENGGKKTGEEESSAAIRASTGSMMASFSILSLGIALEFLLLL